MLATILAEEDLYRLPIALQALIVALAFLSGIVVAAGFFMTPWARTHWQELHGGQGGGWPRFAWISANTVYVWATAAWAFALMSGFLYEHDVVTTAADGALGRPVGDAWQYYAWSFLDAIPVLELPRTLGWELGFRFTDRVSPVLLLLYKLVVILPLLETARLIWRGRPVAGLGAH